MLRSMTGFSRAEVDDDRYRVSVELRSVNHRYLDVRLKGAPGLVALERRVRDRIASDVSRGKVEAGIYVQPKEESAYQLEVDHALLADLVETARTIASETGVSGALSASDLVGFSPAFQVKERDLGGGEAIWQVLESGLAQALEALNQMREAEGAELEADLKSRISTLGATLERIEALSKARRESKRAELEEKVQELLGSSVEPSAIAMEVARLVERADITEEITRFRSHIELWRQTTSTSEPCGKKLDFIVQEMNREANTIGSKSQDAEIAEHVIGVKSELERVREQVQNVE